MSNTHRIYINRDHVFYEGVTWATVAGLYPHAYVPEEEYNEALARAEKAEAALRDAIKIGDAVFNNIGDGLRTDSLEVEWDEKSSAWADIAEAKP